jgi:hypothetical protein
MPLNDSSAEVRYKEIRDEANDYRETVQTLLAFAAFVCHTGQAMREGSRFGFGRRMRTSTKNLVSPETDITPDCVTQKHATYGIAAEAKKQISRQRDYWEAHVQQLRKYDDELTGWWTDEEKIAHSDAILLIHQSRGRDFSRFLQLQKEADDSKVGENTSVVEFNRSDEGRPYIFFRREWGSVHDAELAGRLDSGVQVPLDRVLKTFPSVLFYDSPPPLEDMMRTLWMDSFFSRFDPSTVDPGTGVASITVGVSEISTELQLAYGSAALDMDPRSAKFPKDRWVRDALEAFAKLDMAISVGDGEQFVIKYKVLSSRDDVLERFVQLLFAKARDTGDETQLTLLPGS